MVQRLLLLLLLLLLLVLLEGFEAELGLVLPGYMSPHGVVAGKRTGAKRAGNSDALMPLSYVGPQVGLVAVQSLTKRALQFLS